MDPEQNNQGAFSNLDLKPVTAAEWKLIEILRNLRPYDSLHIGINQSGSQISVVTKRKTGSGLVVNTEVIQVHQLLFRKEV